MNKLLYILLLLPSLAMAEINFGVGTSGASSRVAEGSSVRIGWNDEKQYQWFANVSWHGKYQDKDDTVDSHVMITGGKRILAWEFANDWLLYGDLGAAWTSKTSTANSSIFTFSEEIGVQYKKVSLGIKHTSNAGIVKPNHGENSIYLTYHFK